MLSDAGLSALSMALRRHKCITLARTCSDKTVTVRTLLGGYPWQAEMLVQVRVERPGVSWVQTLEGLDEAREVLSEQAKV